jgi:hypothetical protein
MVASTPCAARVRPRARPAAAIVHGGGGGALLCARVRVADVTLQRRGAQHVAALACSKQNTNTVNLEHGSSVVGALSTRGKQQTETTRTELTEDAGGLQIAIGLHGLAGHPRMRQRLVRGKPSLRVYL